MRVAVLTVTRDRRAYSVHCFNKLRENAGCEFDHFVFDNGSQDGTDQWLFGELQAGRIKGLVGVAENQGLSQGFNKLLDFIERKELTYDVIVKMDNDCEIVTPGTLRRTAELAAPGYLLSPKILGLNHPPPTLRYGEIAGEPVEIVPNIGGIFMAAPAGVFRLWRAPEHALYSYEDVSLSNWWREQGGTTAYLVNYNAWHYERVDEQHEKYPAYQERKMMELA